MEGRILGLQLMEVAEAAYLATIDEEGFPQTRAVFNLRNRDQFPLLAGLFQAHKDSFLALFSTNTSSTKVQQLKANAAASVYYCKPGEWRGLMLRGRVDIAPDSELKKAVWQNGWERYYPKGLEDPDYTVLSMYPDKASYYHRLDKCSFTFGGDE
jgi:general stress protein 26